MKGISVKTVAALGLSGLCLAAGALFVAQNRDSLFSGGAFYDRNDSRALIADCSLAIELDPQNAWAWAKRGHLLIEWGRFGEARRDCRKAIGLGLDSYPVLYDACISSFETGDTDSALALSRRAVAAGGEKAGDSYVIMGRCLLAAGREREAEDAFLAARELGADAREHIIAGLGEVYFRTGRILEAAQEYERGHGLFPSSPDFLVEAARCYMELGDREKTFAALAAVPEKIPFALSVEVQACLKFGLYERALEGGERLLAAEPDSAQARILRGRALFETGRYGEAVDDFTAALGAEPSNAWIFFCRAMAYVGKDDGMRAFADFDSAIALAPDMAAAYVERGRLCLQIGRRGQARADFARAAVIEPSNPEIKKLSLECADGPRAG